MTKTQTGYIIFIAAVGMLIGAIAVDVVALMDWQGVIAPKFVGGMMMHVSSTIGAFVGGKLIPGERDVWSHEERTEKLGTKLY